MRNNKIIRKYLFTISIIILIGTISAFMYSNFYMPKRTLEKLNINSKNVTRIDISSNYYDRKAITITKREEVEEFSNWINSVKIKFHEKNTAEGYDGESYIITFLNGDKAITSIGLKDGIMIGYKDADYKIINEKLDVRFLDRFFLY